VPVPILSPASIVALRNAQWEQRRSLKDAAVAHLIELANPTNAFAAELRLIADTVISEGKSRQQYDNSRARGIEFSDVEALMLAFATVRDMWRGWIKISIHGHVILALPDTPVMDAEPYTLISQYVTVGTVVADTFHDASFLETLSEATHHQRKPLLALRLLADHGHATIPRDSDAWTRVVGSTTTRSGC
jgi:hypothetical protein